ncbi:MAG: OmpA family protein [Pseudomonas sp.]|nr:OmpA family protein [Thiopseudomonas sp.]MCK9533524.1 OmpA family protein [Pseudomonas sp.]
MERIFGKSQSKAATSAEAGEHWVSLSDLMAGLMMVFMLISIAFMQYVKEREGNITDVAAAYQNTQVALFEQLYEEFKSDLSVWDAEINKETLEFSFNSPEVLFDTGAITLKPQFKQILDDFFPRYLGVIKNFKDSISEIRIEGHTSSIWNRFTSDTEAYFNNMELSQGRTRAVLQHVYTLDRVVEEQEWIKSKFAAVGFSSSKLVRVGGVENVEGSRRVTFKVFTNAETQIRKILAKQNEN